jgi:hypothetical protein
LIYIKAWRATGAHFMDSDANGPTISRLAYRL